VVRHGDVNGVVAILEAAASSPSLLADKGAAGRRRIEQGLDQASLRSALCDILETDAAPK
jgi:hypothetical protein